MTLVLLLLQLFVGLVLALVCGLLWIHWIYCLQIRVARTLPTVEPPVPVLGHIPLIYIGKGRVEDRIFKITVASGVKLSVAWIGPTPYFVINSPSEIMTVLNNSKCLQKSPIYKCMSLFLGNGLLTAPVDLWKKSRKEMDNMFKLPLIHNLIPDINKSADILVDDLSKHAGEGIVDLMHHISEHFFLMIMKFIFGSKLLNDRKSGEFTRLERALTKAAEFAGLRVVNPAFIIEPVINFFRKNEMKEIRRSRKVLAEMFEKRKCNIETTSESERGKTIHDVFSYLKSVNPIFDDDYRMDEIMTIITTGMETNASTVYNCLIALGAHPEIQDKLYQEIIEVVGIDCVNVTLEDINKMSYLDQVLKETLRRFNGAPIIARRCDIDIQIGDCIIPKGSDVVVSIMGLHLNPEIYPDPLRFDPDRFLPENVAKRHRYSFLPFSGGSRNCIGKTYALLSMKIALVHLLRRYKYTTHTDLLEIVYHFNIFFRTIGNHVSFEKRNKSSISK